jgi:hypothetical protein
MHTTCCRGRKICIFDPYSFCKCLTTLEANGVSLKSINRFFCSLWGRNWFFFYIIYISFSTQAQKLKFLSFKNTPRQKLLSLHQPLKRQRERLVHCSIFMYPTGRCPSVSQLPSTGLPPHSRVLIQYILTTPLHLMDFPVLPENFPLKVYRIFWVVWSRANSA